LRPVDPREIGTFDRTDPLQIVQRIGRIRDAPLCVLRCRIPDGSVAVAVLRTWSTA
jgi:hypothetical protein